MFEIRNIRCAPALALLAALCVTGVAPAAAAIQATTGQDEASRQLADEILVLARAQPANTPARVFEARFALLVDARRDECQIVLDALSDARKRVAIPAADAALRDLYATLRACSFGTGATDRGQAGLAPIPSFSVGGGTDYRD